jgi:hypothetical protein
LPVAVGDVFSRELATPQGAVTALGILGHWMQTSVPPLVRRITRNMFTGSAKPLDLRDDSRLLARDCRLGDALALFGGRVANCALAARFRRLFGCQIIKLARAFGFELARADRRRRLR